MSGSRPRGPLEIRRREARFPLGAAVRRGEVLRGLGEVALLEGDRRAVDPAARAPRGEEVLGAARDRPKRRPRGGGRRAARGEARVAERRRERLAAFPVREARRGLAVEGEVVDLRGN